MKYNRIIFGKCQDVLMNFPNDCIDLVVTSPPYDNLRDYNIKDCWNDESFHKLVKQLYRIIKIGGVVVWNVNDQTINGSETGTSFYQALYFMNEGFLLNDTMIWYKNNPMPQVKQLRYSQCFEYMFVFSKGKPKTFNPLMIPTQSGKKIYTSSCKNGSNPENRIKKIIHSSGMKIDDNVWKFPVAKNKFHFKHPAVFPYELPLRHIKTWTNEGDVVLDPFSGSGTTCLAAKNLKRKYIGIELNPMYLAHSILRLNKNII